MKKIPFTCPRCGYETKIKTHMQNHLYVRQNVCNASISSLELTEEIKAIIIRDRIYRPPPPQKTKPSITNNNYKQINYIINNTDLISKVEKITAHKQTPLIDLSQHTEDVFMSRIKKLNNDEVSNYQLTMDNLVAFVDELTNVKTVDRMNIMYDKRAVCMMIFNNGCWNTNHKDDVHRAIVQSIKEVYLDVYECYVLRKIYGQGTDPGSRTQFRERLKEYYRFIFAFGMEPGVKGCSNADILNNIEYNDYTIADEMTELFTKSTDGMQGSDIKNIIKQAKTKIFMNCTLVIRDLDKQIRDCMSQDPDFCELMANT